MDGLKLAHAVRGRWPPIKILLVSGQVRLHPSQLPSSSRFVGKPYRAAAMVEELRTLVGLSYSSAEPPTRPNSVSFFLRLFYGKRLGDGTAQPQ
jgi:hypothetical protein